MVTHKKNLFRQQAVEQAASPERLDQLIQVVNPKQWLSLIATGTLVVAGLGWSVFGRIPLSVAGQGVLVYPSEVVSLQSSGSGRLSKIQVKVGDIVKKGDVIAVLDQSELEKQLQLAQAKLAQLQVQNQTANTLEVQRRSIEQQAIEQQRQTLQQSLQTAQNLTPVLREKGVESIQRDRENLLQRLQATEALIPTYQERLQEREDLLADGAVTEDVVLQARQDYLNGVATLNDVQSQLKQLDVKEAAAEREYLQSVNAIEAIQTQLKDLDRQAASQIEQDLAITTNRQKEIQETERTIAQLELQLQNNSQIVSDYDGRVLELTVAEGQLLERGVRIGSIAAHEEGETLTNVAFLPVSEGKKVKPGMTVQVTPSTVKREEFGGITGTVQEVSAFPVTQAAAAQLVGNPDILPGIMTNGPHVSVLIELQPDEANPSGFEWSSSQGPDLTMTPGTTSSLKINVEERAPITFVIPILKQWAGLN